MEVVQGTEADRKGGHIARRRADGQLVLRETRPDAARGRGVVPRLPPLALLQHQQPVGRPARCSPSALEQSGGVLELPLIVNRKTVDPRDADSTPVIQLESAMGAAIESFPGAESAARPADALRAGQDHRRPARAALRRLRARRRPGRRAGRPTAPTTCPSSSSTSASTSCIDDFERAVPRRRRRRCARPSGWSCTATSPSAPASWCAAPSSSTSMRRPASTPGTVLEP